MGVLTGDTRFAMRLMGHTRSAIMASAALEEDARDIDAVVTLVKPDMDAWRAMRGEVPHEKRRAIAERIARGFRRAKRG